MKLEFHGAAGEVTGSCHLLEVSGRRILLDCGMIQGGRKADGRNRAPFPFDPADIDAVVLSRAHIDHSGRIPLLVKRGFGGKVHAQEAAVDLCRVMLRDAASLAEWDAESENRRRRRKGLDEIQPLYHVADAEAALRSFIGHPYDRMIELLPGLQIRFREAGHILGSSVIEIWADEDGTKRKIVYSGDLGQYDAPILRDPAAIDEADLVVMESTYGGHRHRSPEETVEEIGRIIRDAQAGNILIPAFAVGRTQEILFYLARHFDQWGLDRWDIFLDSPMAIEATEIYAAHANLHDDQARELANSSAPVLPNLHFTRSTEESMALNRITRGAIIIAGSGMCTGGRILHHLRHNLWRQECHVIIVGYQAYGTLGRRLVEHADRVRIFGETIRVAAQVHTVGGLSAHGDENALARWYSRMKGHPPVVLVHGEADRAEAMQHRLESEFSTRVAVATPGMTIDLIEGL